MPLFYPDFLQSILIGCLTDWQYFNSCSKKQNSYLAFYLSGITLTTCLSEENDICVLWQRNLENCISECLTATFTPWPTVSCAQKDILTPPQFVFFVTFYHKNRVKVSPRYFVQKTVCIQKGWWFTMHGSIWGSLRIISPCLHFEISSEL